jgi:hypothetical protein
MAPPQRNHDNCSPGCLWCALQKALAARPTARGSVPLGDGSATQNEVTPTELLHDVDQLCNFLGDLVASEPSDDGFESLCRLASQWLSNRVMESRARNMRHPIWRAQHERANGAGGTA